jgi:hypothetical protein
MTTHVNKVHHVTTINRVAEDLGVDEDWLRDVANGMEIEDGVIWVYGVGEDGVHRLRDRKPDRARPDVQRKSGMAQALETRII